MPNETLGTRAVNCYVARTSLPWYWKRRYWKDSPVNGNEPHRLRYSTLKVRMNQPNVGKMWTNLTNLTALGYWMTKTKTVKVWTIEGYPAALLTSCRPINAATMKKGHFGGFSAEEEDGGDGYGLFLVHWLLLTSLLAVPTRKRRPRSVGNDCLKQGA